MDNLRRVGEKENVKKMGVSPFAKKKKSTVPTTTIRVSLKNRDDLKILATKKHMSMYDYVNKMIEEHLETSNVDK